MPIRLAIQQRVIPAYRVPFLELLSSQPNIELGVFAGAPRENERINYVKQISHVDFHFSNNIHILKGFFIFVCNLHSRTGLDNGIRIS